jgi:hypothetical protein
MSVPNIETQCQLGTGGTAMRELRDWHGHGEHRHRHARDATADAPGKHARDAPKHAALMLRARQESARP